MSKTKPPKPATVSVRVRCMMCKTERDIGPNDVKPGDHPMCEKDFMPMTPIEASARTR